MYVIAFWNELIEFLFDLFSLDRDVAIPAPSEFLLKNADRSALSVLEIFFNLWPFLNASCLMPWAIVSISANIGIPFF